MTKLTVLSPITHDGKDFKAGDKFEGSDEVVRPLILAGALEDPDRPKTVVETSEIDAAKAEATKIIESAKDEAAKVLHEAQLEATKIVESAQKTVGTPGGDSKSK